MELKFKFDIKKAIAVILYVSTALKKKMPSAKVDFYRVLKILYFAEAEQMAQYGIPITGDRYVAMQYGPVPSNTYDLIKISKGNSIFNDSIGIKNYFSVLPPNYIEPLTEPNMDEFSEVDIESLNYAIEENWNLSFEDLHQKSSTSAYKDAVPSDDMDIVKIVKDNGGDENAIQSLKEHSENERLFSKV